METKQTTHNLFENESTRVQRICTEECQYSDRQDQCYFICLANESDYGHCMKRHIGRTGHPRCMPPDWYFRSSPKYGELPR
jgi:hypothetical protein